MNADMLHPARVITLILGTIFLHLSGCWQNPAPTGKPNIIFLFSDDQRWDTVGANGNAVIQTPHLDRLARDGLNFRNCFVTTSICAISRASVLSGQHMRRHGIRDFVTPFDKNQLQQTYPVILQRAGYYTGFIGKWGVGASPENIMQAAGYFDWWQGQPFQTNYWHEADCVYVGFNGHENLELSLCDCPADETGASGPRVRTGQANLHDPIHLTTQIVPAKIHEFLDTRETDKPFCLTIFFKAPHGPFDHDSSLATLYQDVEMPIPRTATPHWADRRPAFLRDDHHANHKGKRWVTDHQALQQRIRVYYRLITGMDIAVGKLVEALKDAGVADNTVIVFTSDNGQFLGEHGFHGKWLMREPSIRVPAFIYDPRRPPEERGRECDAMVLNIDFAPTILDLAGLPQLDSIQGRSLLQLMDNPSAVWRHDWFYEHPTMHIAPIQPTTGVRNDRWKYTKYTAQFPPYEELFDLENDPDETRNLVGSLDHAEILQLLREQCSRSEVELH